MLSRLEIEELLGKKQDCENSRICALSSRACPPIVATSLILPFPSGRVGVQRAFWTTLCTKSLRASGRLWHRTARTPPKCTHFGLHANLRGRSRCAALLPNVAAWRRPFVGYFGRRTAPLCVHPRTVSQNVVFLTLSPPIHLAPRSSRRASIRTGRVRV